MSVLQPFRALFGLERLLFIPGEDDPPPVNEASLAQDREPALFLYQQHFEGSLREGVMGLLDRASARVYPHEETEAWRVARCHEKGIETGSLYLWTSGVPLPRPSGPAAIDVCDRFGCRHKIWRVGEPKEMSDLQEALAGKQLFLADGHHRFAAGWELATIQIRAPALESLAAHRVVVEGIVTLPRQQPVDTLETYWAGTPEGFARFGVMVPEQAIFGVELECKGGEHGLSALHRQCLRGTRVRPVRGFKAAVDEVQSGRAKMVFLVQPVAIDRIEADAERGVLLPPKSTDFFPKLAGGLIMHRRQNDRSQNDTFAPPTT